LEALLFDDGSDLDEAKRKEISKERGSFIIID
jgi:hypothetical protein